LVNARHVKNLPGRKTDVSDAAWLAQLGAHGLLHGSPVPPEPIRQLRDLTRTRTSVTRQRGQEIQRLEKLLEDAGIKLSSVASDITGVSGRAMLEALIAGEHDPGQLADLAKRRLRSKIPALTEALTGRFTEHHAFLTRMHLDLIDQHTKAIAELTARIEVVIEPFRGFRNLICTIPGISTGIADVVTAETGADTRFPTAGHLASWAGTTPGNNESAGRIKSTKTRPGNPYLQGALGTAAMAITRSSDTYFAAKYRRIAARRGPVRAIVAVQHACSSRSGTWAPPGRSTTTQEATSTHVSTPNEPRPEPSSNSTAWATRSLSDAPGSERGLRHEGNLRVRGLMRSHYKDYPVGGHLVWETETDGASVRGSAQGVGGIKHLLLDGQQRITTLYGVAPGRPQPSSRETAPRLATSTSTLMTRPSSTRRRR
jgi:transposase